MPNFLITLMLTTSRLFGFCLLSLAALAFNACGDDGDGGSTGPVTNPDPEPDNSIGIEMVRIEPGTYMRGEDGFQWSAPTHQVTITKPFLIGKYEMLGSHVIKVMGEGFGPYDSDRHPIDSITWLETVTICNAMSEYESLTPVYTIVGEDVTWDQNANGYRLPTEGEWELACRGGTSTSTYNGETPKAGSGPSPVLDEIAWYERRFGVRDGLQAVGLKKPNQFGLYDCIGNVWEYVWDWDNVYSSEPLTDPTGPEGGFNRISRGGGFTSNVLRARSSTRHFVNPATYTRFLQGFRVVRNVE